MKIKPSLLLTIGDINGIGPEIIIKTLINKTITKKFNLTVISPIEVLEYYGKLLKVKLFAHSFNILPFNVSNLKITPGNISKQAGLVSAFAIEYAVYLLLNKEFDAMVTAPINKKSLNLAGINFIGHTEMLASLSNSKSSCMTMLSDKLKIAVLTNHTPIKSISQKISKKFISSKLKICSNMLSSDLKINKPKIAVLGLNPHAGDSGLIGTEEKRFIVPAIKSANRLNKNTLISGPYSADAFFAFKNYVNFDLTVSVFHDQGLIPFKMLAGANGINYTAGLNIIRTSPGHGTAFDIAGKNIASNISFINAVKWADLIARNKVSFNP